MYITYRIIKYANNGSLWGQFQKSRSLVLQKPLSWMFEKVLNMLLNWLPKLKMFLFKISLNIKVTDNLLPGKTKRTSKQLNENVVKQN